MARSSGGRRVRRGRKQSVKKGRVRRHVVFIPKTIVTDTITLIPLDSKTGFPIFGKARVEERRKLHKGYHSRWRALLLDDNRIFRMGEIFYLREVMV